MKPPTHILVIRPEKLGDLVVATPVFRALKESFGGCRVTLLVDPVNGCLAEGSPFVDEIVKVPWAIEKRAPGGGWWSLLWQLRRKRFDAAVVLYNGSEPMNWLCAALGIRRVAQLGGTVSAVLLRHKMVLRKWHTQPEHFSKLYLKVASEIGAKPTDGLPELFLSEEERVRLRSELKVFHGQPPLVVHPFAVSASAQMAVDAFVRLAEVVASRIERPMVLCGTRAELAQLATHGPSRICRGFGRDLTLRETAVALSLSAGVIGGSSGIVHLAAAVGTPTVGIYCPAHFHPIVWGPLGRHATSVSVPETQCRKMGATVHRCGDKPVCRFQEFCAMSDLATIVLRELGMPDTADQ